VSVAAASRHSAAVSHTGALFTWGSNEFGQLGHVGLDGPSLATPRSVDALKNRRLQQVAAAERHTVVLTSDGDILQWGHGSPVVRRVALAGSSSPVHTYAKRGMISALSSTICLGG
jgi:alpha-tubulin suppressor-like RCC1 family protein